MEKGAQIQVVEARYLKTRARLDDGRIRGRCLLAHLCAPRGSRPGFAPRACAATAEASSGPDAPPDARTIGWKIQREIILLLAWGPAILLQVAHPLIAQGVADHSAFRTQRWGRTRRFHGTLDAMLRLCFGTEQEREAVLARINSIHDTVHGRLPGPAGIFSAGTSYSAHDPALLTWVHATLLDMNLRVYDRFLAPLKTSERDRYCAEAALIEGPLGVPAGSLPRSDAQLQQYMNSMLTSGQLDVTDVARALARDVLSPPWPLVGRPAMWWPRLITLGLLPSAIRAAYGFAWDSRKERLFELSTTLSRRLLPLAPAAVRHWPSAYRPRPPEGAAAGFARDAIR